MYSVNNLYKLFFKHYVDTNFAGINAKLRYVENTSDILYRYLNDERLSEMQEEIKIIKIYLTKK